MNPVARVQSHPTAAVLVGLALNLASFVWWEGPGRSESLQEYTEKVGALYRRDAITTVLLSMPGYVLAFGGVAALLWRRRESSRFAAWLARAIVVVMAAAAALDLAQVVLGLVGAGLQDLNSPSVAVTSWPGDVWFTVFLRSLNVFVLGFVLCVIGLLSLLFHRLRRFAGRASVAARS